MNIFSKGMSTERYPYDNFLNFVLPAISTTKHHHHFEFTASIMVQIKCTNATIFCLGCPAGFTGYMSSCYQFSNDTLNWIDAEKDCQKTHHKAHLVAVESKMENDYILQYRLFNNGIWF